MLAAIWLEACFGKLYQSCSCLAALCCFPVQQAHVFNMFFMPGCRRSKRVLQPSDTPAVIVSQCACDRIDLIQLIDFLQTLCHATHCERYVDHETVCMAYMRNQVRD
jgi:hypothetical protein